MSGSHAEGVQIEVFVRSLAPPGAERPQEAVVKALERLTERGTVDDYTVTVCGKEVPVRREQVATSICEHLLSSVAAFEAWADQNDRELDGVFDRKEVHSSITNEDHVCRITPVLALAEYEGPDLRFVAPSGNRDDRVTVLDRIEELDRGVHRTEADPLPDVRDRNDAHRSPPVATR